MEIYKVLFLCAVAQALASTAESARILALFPMPGKSHFNAVSPLLEELAKRGHDLTVVTAFPRTKPLKNYKDIQIEDYLRKQNTFNAFQIGGIHPIFAMPFMGSISLSNCDKFFNYPQIQELVHSDQKFDLIIFEIFFTECAYGFVHKFQAPFVQISTSQLCTWMGEGVGNPNLFSSNPDLMLGLSDHMSFTERLENFIFGIYIKIFRNWYLLPRMEEIMRKHFPDPSVPSIHQIETNASFLLLNSHVSLHYPRPLTPNTAEVAGMHIKDPEKLPEDLQKFMDDAPNGVIYFSLGSYIRSTHMPDEMREAYVKTFSRLKQKILWKWENDTLPGQPKNVRISKWLPQKDILAHPNMRLFITHGGLLSTQEATYRGVPLVAMPIAGDQRLNAQRAQKAGYAIALDTKKITEETVSWALNEVLNNPSYSENAKRLSKILQDQPQKPLERAVFWIEYVIRHDGAPHMRSAALKLNFFQYFCLDVLAVVLLGSLSALAVFVFTCRAVCRRICSRKSRPVSSSKKNK